MIHYLTLHNLLLHQSIQTKFDLRANTENALIWESYF